MQHTFHIPVLGLGYSIDTPLKVARFGISSVVSIVDDELTERMRKHYCGLHGLEYKAIGKKEHDSRARRITAYLNLLNKLVDDQVQAMREEDFQDGTDLGRYFEMLPEGSELKKMFSSMLEMEASDEKRFIQNELKAAVAAGRIDVNIMSKVDKANYLDGVYLGDDQTDALAAIRGFAESDLRSSVVISAGLNPRLFSYMEQLEAFYPAGNEAPRKEIILKVSDYRSALIQAKILAKKGLWVSEFRIESGLNCGGHAFATDGLLLGPILQEFKDNRAALYAELFDLYASCLRVKGIEVSRNPAQRVCVQGGIGTAEEHTFLLKEYGLDATGWGSPFLLVPEATSVDMQTLADLGEATDADFYLSNSSPLGVLFNNFKKSSAEAQRQQRIDKGRPGSPCTKKYLCTNTEFTEEPICTASREYQHLKIKQLNGLGLAKEELQRKIDQVTEKVCLCVGLCTSAYQKHEILKAREDKAVSICPGPNLAYFSGTYSLREMVGHIYGRCNLLVGVFRPNLFIKELNLYIDYLKKEFELLAQESLGQPAFAKRSKQLDKFYAQLNEGAAYYRSLLSRSEATLQMWNADQVRRLDQAISHLRSMVTFEALPAV
ncbi:hypothetical protein [Pedobacter deserti]|uniref:hypothetical protein n=1 Tax=Pedobacter deserti TaxID=2817382 RepID=UPI00210AAD0A|nr:hypothetical protein [Pedobacter sp. SYSU D00382]